MTTGPLMQLLTGLGNDSCHVLNNPGAYEWWYADAISADAEWAVVMILFRGVPMSADYLRNPSDRTGGYALSVYHKGSRIAFHFGGYHEHECTFGVAPCDVAVGPHRMRLLPDGTIHCSITPESIGKGQGACVKMTLSGGWNNTDKAPFTGMHGWVLAAPRTQAQVSIELFEGSEMVSSTHFETMAYHDHNMGSRAMWADFQDWYWGRVHTPENTFVFLATPNAAEPFAWAGRVASDGSVHPWNDVRQQLSGTGLSLMGLRTHRTITISGEDDAGSHVLTCKTQKVCENAPFYQRLLSEWTHNNLRLGIGMSEYMDVSRLRLPAIRPFLRLPWVYHAEQL